ncbi:F-type conjugal transfer pilus assembly protein TraB [Serratia liquefaciens]|uniref:F-type conjugal transfer pilus assembly protein TraB n=1 Tax=Serratia liquefaciens TaxID=614 RepID=UPI003905C10D
MGNINTQVKRRQVTILAGLVAVLVCAGGLGWYFTTMSFTGARHEQVDEPAPDMTGVVDSTFDGKVQQSAITQTQVTQAELKTQYDRMQKDMADLKKQREEDQARMGKLEDENNQLRMDMSHANFDAPVGEPAPNAAAPAPGSIPTPTPGTVPPPTAFYPGIGTGEITQGPVSYVKTPTPGKLESKVFDYSKKNNTKKYPYIPSGSFAPSMVIEGADANAAVTGNENTAPMQFRLTGKIRMPNDKIYDATGCFVSAAAYGDVSSERAIVRTRKISCLFGKDTIDMDIAGHVSFMGKNGIKGEVVMREGKILGWAAGAGFIEGIGQGMQTVATPVPGLGATASVGAGDVLKSGIGSGVGEGSKTISGYLIKRAEQYHPIIPIGAGNEVTIVFQDGFQLKTIEEVLAEKENRQNQDEQIQPQGNTPNMMNQLGSLKIDEFMNSGNNGK